MEKRIRNFDDSSLYEDFEMLVKKILERNGFKVQKMLKNEGYDFSAIIENTVTYVEVKLYKSKLPKLDLLRQAYRRLSAQKNDEYIKLILVISSYVTPSLKAEILKKSGVVVWDAKTLFALAFDFSILYYELESILTRAFNEQLNDLIVIDDKFKSEIIPSLKKLSAPFIQKQIDNEGEKLCKELNALQPGTKDATNYERKCTEILKYLFDNNTDLTLWEEQPTTEDGLHRFDLLCRIISSHHNTFWAELAHDFVLFEFKNYTEEIKQGQIYTTEKYLFLTALRSVSFIITRKGADANAIKAAKGALKEAGKLIVILTNEDICRMLKMKSEGDEPAIILRGKIDEMLRTLTR